MNRYYRTFRPIQGVQIAQGTAQPLVLPAGSWLQVSRHRRRWPDAVSVVYRGAKVILFFQDLCDCAAMQAHLD